jgi:integrase
VFASPEASMKAVRITKRQLDAMKPGGWLRDLDVRGFYARCRPSGEIFFQVTYRTAGGRQRFQTVGRFGDLTVEKARDLARDIKHAARKGADPQGERQRKRKEGTISAVADEFVKKHVRIYNKPSTQTSTTGLIEQLIKPKLGKIKVGELGPGDVAEWHANLKDTPYRANRALAALRKMMNWAGRRDSDNPCSGTEKYPEPQRERFFSSAELKKIGAALAAIDKEKAEAEGFTLAIRILSVTGLRLGDVLGLKWNSVNLSERTLSLADSKAGPRPVQLSAPAAALINAVEHRTGYVVSGDGGTTPLTTITLEQGWKRLRKRAGLQNARIHDLRHSVATHGAILGASAFAIRDLLGQKTLVMASRYVARANDIARTAAEAAASHIAAAMNADDEPNNVATIVTAAR